MVNSKNIDSIKFHYENKLSSGDFFPSVYVIEPISICDLNCVMCPNSELEEEQLGFMPVDQFDAITKDVAPYAELVMIYFMGEPLLHPDFEMIISIARRNIRGRIVLSTNCMQLSTKFSEILVEHQIDLVICCIDHWTKERYEKIRVGGNFETVINNVERLLKIKANNERPLVLVRSLDFGFTKQEELDYCNYWKNLGALPLIGWVDSWAGQMPGLKKLNYKVPPNQHSKRVACADLWFKMVINWKGEVVLCCHNFDYSISLGHTITGILDIWQSKKIEHLRYFHINNAFGCNKLCNKCSEWGTLKELDLYTTLNYDDLYLVF